MPLKSPTVSSCRFPDMHGIPSSLAIFLLCTNLYLSSIHSNSTKYTMIQSYPHANDLPTDKLHHSLIDALYDSIPESFPSHTNPQCKLESESEYLIPYENPGCLNFPTASLYTPMYPHFPASDDLVQFMDAYTHMPETNSHTECGNACSDPLPIPYFPQENTKSRHMSYLAEPLPAYPSQSFSQMLMENQNIPDAPQASPELEPILLPHMASQRNMQVAIRMGTQLQPKYWRNGRQNLQCFPRCQSYGDYYLIELKDLKTHDNMWGKCRGSIKVHVLFLTKQMQAQKITLLARIEDIPLVKNMSEFIPIEDLHGRIFSSNQMLEMQMDFMTGEMIPSEHKDRCTFSFKPKVWKHEEAVTRSRKIRKGKQYHLRFEAFAVINKGSNQIHYVNVGSGFSSPFEVGSTRVLARQKRKAASDRSKKF